MNFKQFFGLLVLVICLYTLWQIRQVLLVVFASIILATVLNQVVKFLIKIHIKRGIAIFITVTLFFTVITGFCALILPQMIQQLQELADILPLTLERIHSWNSWLLQAIPAEIVEETRGLENITQGLQSSLNQLINNFFTILSNSLNIVLTILLFLVLTIMFLAEPYPYRKGFIMLFPTFYRRRVSNILSLCETSLLGWIKGTLLTMLVIAVLSYVGLVYLEIKLPLVNAILAGLLEFIPNVGPTLSVIPPLLLGLIDAPWKAAAVIGLYFVIQQIESLVIVPLVMKSQVSLMPAITLLSVVIFASFFGFLGLFLAIPLTIVLQIWIQEALIKDVLNKWQNNNNNNQNIEKVLLINSDYEDKIRK
ncbi:AI-2E family transporter [Mastigocoleus testarum]|uniref:Permease n=1 Tax=Mastigocoleus testarum BC008 TaxID=371196 RepID=A0A0V7ZZV6_9CYAN|nr:AI-2E family transporter [Mastigocoleus testarum]KST69979.1 hypothetical protein BC008_05950 [Mastigocoleus testarum BC008]